VAVAWKTPVGDGGTDFTGRTVRGGISCGVAVAVRRGRYGVTAGRAVAVAVIEGRTGSLAVGSGIGVGVAVGTTVKVSARVGIPNGVSGKAVVFCEGIDVPASNRHTVNKIKLVI